MTNGSHSDVSHLASNQEEVDTKLVLHALDCKLNGAEKLAGFLRTLMFLSY